LSQVVSDAMLAELKQCFMEAYDDNQDGKIEIIEVCYSLLVIYSKLTFNSMFVFAK
jgi:Ca2+-binding EF-hand superfamily protein